MDIPFRLPPVLRAGAQPADKQVAEKLVGATQKALTKVTAEGHGSRFPGCTVTLGRDGEWDTVSFRLPILFGNNSTELENAIALRILMNLLIAFDIYILSRGSMPLLYDSGIIYKRTEEWDTLLPLHRRRFGDCKTLMAARIAELRRNGIGANPTFRCQPAKQRKDDLYHLLIQVDRPTQYSVQDGASFWEDPSKVCGMTGTENDYRKVG